MPQEQSDLAAFDYEVRTFSFRLGASVTVAVIASFTLAVVGVASLHAYCFLMADDVVRFALLLGYNYTV